MPNKTADHVSIDRLVHDDHNARRHTERNLEMIRESLHRFGANRGVVAARQGDGTYKVYAGNGVLEAARAEGFDKVRLVEVSGDEIPVMVVDHLTEDQLLEYALADNRTGELSEWDSGRLQEAIDSGLNLDWMWNAEEMDLLLADLEPDPEDSAGGLTDPDEVPDVPEVPETKPGDIWVLGRHRVLCGDSTDADSYRKLLSGVAVDMVWTDPPYGVAVGDKNAYLDTLDRGSSNRITENLKNDDISEGDLRRMLHLAFKHAFAVSRQGAVWHVAAPQGPLHLVFGEELQRLGIWRQTIQWVKNNATFSPMGVDYHWKAEPIFHGWVPGAKHHYSGGRKQTTVWDFETDPESWSHADLVAFVQSWRENEDTTVWRIDRPSASPEHPTMKPVALVTKSLQNHTKPGDAVLDMFGGSGTTIIAAQDLGRSAYLIELDPKYVDVIVKRWADYTGLEPVLEV